MSHFNYHYFYPSYWVKNSTPFSWVTMKNVELCSKCFQKVRPFCVIFKHYELFMVIVFYNISCTFCSSPPFIIRRQPSLISIKVQSLFLNKSTLYMKTRIIKRLTTHIVQKKVIGHVVHPSRPSGDPFGGLSVPEEKLWLGRDNS